METPAMRAISLIVGLLEVLLVILKCTQELRIQAGTHMTDSLAIQDNQAHDSLFMLPEIGAWTKCVEQSMSTSLLTPALTSFLAGRTAERKFDW